MTTRIQSLIAKECYINYKQNFFIPWFINLLLPVYSSGLNLVSSANKYAEVSIYWDHFLELTIYLHFLHNL